MYMRQYLRTYHTWNVSVNNSHLKCTNREIIQSPRRSPYLRYVEVAYALHFRAFSLILLSLPNASGVADKKSDDEQRYCQPAESRTSLRSGMHLHRAFRFRSQQTIRADQLDRTLDVSPRLSTLARRLEATYIPSTRRTDARLVTITHGRRGGGHYHVPPFAFLLFLRFQSATCSARVQSS